MMTVGVSPFSNFLNSLADAIKQVSEPHYVTLQKAFRGDPAAIHKIEQMEEQRQLQQRLSHRDDSQDEKQKLDIFA